MREYDCSGFSRFTEIGRELSVLRSGTAKRYR